MGAYSNYVTGVCRASLPCLALGVFQHLFDRRVACKDAAQAVLAQRNGSKLDRLLFDRHGRRALVDQFTNWIRDSQKLVNSFSSFVAGVVTRIATFAVEKLLLAKIAARDTKFRQQRVIR